MARIHFIVNPNRPEIGLRWPYEENEIARMTQDFEVHILRGRQHAELLAREAALKKAELIVSVGGDSTLSAIANGLYRASQGGLHVPKLCLHHDLHRGDAMRSLSSNRKFREFLEAFLKGEALRESMLDLGEVEYTGDFGQKVRRVFVNCLGYGLSSQIVSRLSRNYRISRSRYSFFKLILRILPFYRLPEVNVKLNGQSFCENSAMLTGLIHNGRFAGYGLELSPNSQMNDGKFECTFILKALTTRYLLSIFPLFAGQLGRASFVRRELAETIEINPASRSERSSTAGQLKRIRIDFDGDCWGFLPIRIRVLPGKLMVVQ